MSHRTVLEWAEREQLLERLLEEANRRLKEWSLDEGCSREDYAESILEELAPELGVTWSPSICSVNPTDTGGDRRLVYINTGDTYKSTLAALFDVPYSQPHRVGTFREFLITSWGDWLEHEETRIKEELS